MKIAIDCRMLDSGGIGTFLSELLPFFTEENDCLLIGKTGQCEQFLKNGKTKFAGCNVKTFSVQEMLFFPHEILKSINECDLYFTPYCNIPGGIKIPVFSVIHDIVFLDVKEMTGTLGRLARKFFYQRAINCSQTVFTVSEFSKKRISEKLKAGKKIEVIYNSVPEFIKNSKKEENDTQKEDFILFIGNIKKHKGLSTLLCAYEKAKEKGLSAKLKIVGNWENFRTGDDETVRKINSLSERSIIFTGKISNEELKMTYRKSKVLVQPSLYEGFGLPPLEAMCSGTPAIISDIEVFREIYGKFPVIFFKAGNSDDLAEKLVEFFKNYDEKNAHISLGELENFYSYKNSYRKIIDKMNRSANIN